MKKRRSIYFKNFFTIAVILAISFSLMGVTFVSVSYRMALNEKERSMEDTARIATRIVSAYNNEWAMGGLEVRAGLNVISDISGFHILVCDIDGTVVSCSDMEVNASCLGRSVSPSTLRTINRSGRVSGMSDLNHIYADRCYVVGMAITAPRYADSLLGYIFISGQPETFSEIWQQSAGVFIATALIVMAIAYVGSFIMTKKQTQPIKEMADAAHRFGRGDFSERVNYDGNAEEIGELADSFNAMADSLERAEIARRELIANVSHELKTPMTTITGFADGILDGTVPPEREREYLTVISSEAKRLSRLVRGMLDVSKVQDKKEDELLSGRFDAVEVTARALISLEGRITERGLDVDASLPEEAVMVRGDMDSIMQVVYNLIDNAAKFALPGTAIGISLWKEENKAYISVENEGHTIPRDELPLIFDRFHKTDKSRSEDREGVGLGLYIVKTILDNHNQDIFVTSENGVTKFVFTLELA